MLSSSLKTFKDLSLPSIEGAFDTLNIQKDPPKSVMATPTDKVDIGSLIDSSLYEDIISENIQRYERGVNQFVSVSYRNSDGTPSQLPDTIMKDGAFRPKIEDPDKYLPPSRRPVREVSGFTNKKNLLTSKQCVYKYRKDYKEVKKNPLKISTRPTATFRLEKPKNEINEDFKVKYVIKNPIKSSISSGYKFNINTNNHIEPTDNIRQDNILFNASSNKSYTNGFYNTNYDPDTSGNIQDRVNTSIISNKRENTGNINYDPDTSGNIQDPINISIQSKKSDKTYITPIEEVINTNDYMKENNNVSYTCSKIGFKDNEYRPYNIKLEEKIETVATTNKKYNISTTSDIKYQHKLKDWEPFEVKYNYGKNIKKNNINEEPILKEKIDRPPLEARPQKVLKNKTNPNIKLSDKNFFINKKILEFNQLSKNPQLLKRY